MEAETIRRAVEGVEVPVYGRGPGPNAGSQVVGSVTKYSDRLLELMLRARRPHKFRDRVPTEITGAGGVPVKFTLKLD